MARPWTNMQRAAAALVAAALAPTLALTAIAGPVSLVTGFSALVFLIALAHAGLLGLPAAAMAIRGGRDTWFWAVAAGFLIGALPVALLAAVSTPPDFSESKGVVTAINGVRTQAGWLRFALGPLFFGLCGALGGFGAWAVWRLTAPLPS
jgi:hypothetical protein